jgi:hypothetical protein
MGHSQSSYMEKTVNFLSYHRGSTGTVEIHKALEPKVNIAALLPCL